MQKRLFEKVCFDIFDSHKIMCTKKYAVIISIVLIAAMLFYLLFQPKNKAIYCLQKLTKTCSL